MTPTEIREANERDLEAALVCLPSLSAILEAIEKGRANEVTEALNGVREAIQAVQARGF